MSTANTLYDETVFRGSAKLLMSANASGVASVNFITPFADTQHTTFVLDITDLSAAVAQQPYIQVSSNGGSSWVAASGSYWVAAVSFNSHGADAVTSWNSIVNGAAHTSIPLSAISAGYPMNGQVVLSRGTTGTGIKHMEIRTFGPHFTTEYGICYWVGNGVSGTDAYWNAIRIMCGSGSFGNGRLRLYGLRKGQ